MNKNILFLALAILAVLVVLVLSNSSKNEENNISMESKQQDSMMTDEEKMMDKSEESEEKMMKGDKMMEDDKMMGEGHEDDKMDGDQMMKNGEYRDYDPSLLSRADSGDVVLFFHAGWCPTCKTLDTAIKAEVSNIPSDVTILKVDYDNSSDLKKKYAVTYQHTLVQVDAQANQLNKWNGGSDLSSILSKLK